MRRITANEQRVIDMLLALAPNETLTKPQIATRLGWSISPLTLSQVGIIISNLRKKNKAGRFPYWIFSSQAGYKIEANLLEEHKREASRKEALMRTKMSIGVIQNGKDVITEASSFGDEVFINVVNDLQPKLKHTAEILNNLAKGDEDESKNSRS